MAGQYAIYPSLRDKVVLLTGGAEGIGAAPVELFARQGSKVIFIDIAEESAQETIDRIISLSEEAKANNFPSITVPVYCYGDVTDLNQLQTLTKTITEEHGTIHVLVNNAAAAGGKARIATEDITSETWDFNVNSVLRHVFFLTQAVIPGMKAAGSGSIINLGSIAWRIPNTEIPVYSACKAAIHGLTRVHSGEFGKWNIRVNSVMPGSIATQRQIDEVLTPEYRAIVMQAQSLQRDLTPEDVAKVIVFLASDEASGVTGSSYVVDGGWVGNP